MNEQQAPLLTISLNGQAAIEYDRSRSLSEHQRSSLDNMDRKMDAGIELGRESLVQPDPVQRAQFVALRLVEAMLQNNESLIAAACAYLAERLPDLKQVTAESVDEGYSVDLVFDQYHTEEVSVTFTPKLSS